MDHLRVFAGASAYLIVLIIGIVMYVVSLRQDKSSSEEQTEDSSHEEIQEKAGDKKNR